MDVLAVGPAPRDVAVAGGEVYWSEASADPIRKVATAGGDPISLARLLGAVGLGVVGPDLYRAESRLDALGQDASTVVVRSGLDGSAPQDLAVAGAGVPDIRTILRGGRVIATLCTVSPVTCTIRVVPLDGNSPTDLVTVSTGIERVEGDGTHVYWLENALGGPGGPAPVRRIPIAGGTAEIVVEPAPQALFGAFALAGGDLVVSEVDTRAAVPIAQGTKRRVMKVPAGGGSRTVLGERTGDGGVLDLVLAGPDVVWRDDSGVFSTPLAGGDTTALPAAPLPADYVYQSILPAGGTIYCSARSLLPEFPGFVAPLAGGDISGSVSLPTLFAADNAFIYWSQASGELARAPLAGGSVATVAGGFASRPTIALGGDRIYGAAGPVVKQVGLGGGVPEERLVADDAVIRLTADAEAAYAVTVAGSLWRIPADGGSPQQLTRVLTGGATRVRVAGGYVYWDQPQSPPSLGEAIYRIPSRGGTRALVAESTASVEDLIVAGGFVYFKELGGGIDRVPIDGGAPEPLTGPTWGPMVLAADDTFLFAANGTDVFKLPLGGGDVVTLLQGAVIGPNALAVDATGVYWTDSYYEAVFRLTPK